MSARWPIRPAEVALDLLDERERAVAQRLLADDARFRAEVERLRATAGRLGELDLPSWRPSAPPALDDDRAVTLRPPAPPRARRRPSWRVLVPAGGALAAALVALALVLGSGGGGDGGGAPATTLTLHALAGVPGEARLTISGDRAELRGQGMPPSGPHDYYEAWLADARGRMVSMGTFRVGRDGSVDAHMPVAVDVRRYRLVDVSLEPDDGNPAHSARSVMRATI
jgi:anti-sigma-K factor RskA